VREGEPGLVELWPLVEPPPGGDDVAWDAPLDYVSEASPPALLARRIAATIRGWIDGGEAILRDGVAVPIRPGDVMVLVRRRNAFFVEMVRALKAAGVPVAGADRLVLADHVAIQDLVALARFALLPRDDYALACVLKSPLCGLDDDDLLALCPARGPGGLWKALRARAGERPSWKAAAGDLGDWLAAADFAPPYEFFARVLGPDGGRRRFLARLGAEASDPLDEFLALALAFERENTPSLQGFLRWFSRGGAEIKRDMELARDEVRVMTVHASKGLEAPVVFLPDTVSTPAGRHDPKLFWEDGESGAPLLLWPGGRENDVELSRAARERMRTRRLEEYRRLLYVATTRARDRLVVCGWVDKPLPGEDEEPDGDDAPSGPDGRENWYELLQAALRARLGDGVEEVEGPWGEGGKALRLGVAPPRAPVAAAIVAGPPVELPGWARRPAAVEQRPSKPLSPSSIGAAGVPSGPIAGEAALAARRGSLLHRLFELLPRLEPAARDEAARRLARHAMPDLPAAERDALAREAIGVIEAHPGFFGPGSRAEVPVVGVVGTTAVAGQVDRLVVAEDEVRILDFKSNRQPPARPEDAPQAYVAQLALYRALVAPLYPGRRVRCILVWTAGPSISEIAPEALDAALERL
jgi:ATP-dependent helicase/nuclease subunit A